MKLVYFSLCLFLTTCSVYAGSDTAQMNKSPESLQSPLAQGHKNMEPRFANFALRQRVAYVPRKDLPQDLAMFKKREGIRKAISMIGFTIFFLASMVFGSLGGVALSKTLGSEGRIKGIKWIVIGALAMVLAIYWPELVTRAVAVFMT